MLLIALGSVAAAGSCPIGLALFALVIGTGFLGLLAAAGDVPEDTTISGDDDRPWRRYRLRALRLDPVSPARRDGHGRVDAIARANATAGQAVVFAGTTVLDRHRRTPRIRAAGHRDDGVRHGHRGCAVGARRGDPAASAPGRGGTSHRRPDRPHPPPTAQGVQPTGRLDLPRDDGHTTSGATRFGTPSPASSCLRRLLFHSRPFASVSPTLAQSRPSGQRDGRMTSSPMLSDRGSTERSSQSPTLRRPRTRRRRSRICRPPL